MTALGAAFFDDVRGGWAAQIGVTELEALEAHLNRLVVYRPLGADDLARPGDGD